ncbi:MAG: hypothetical protein LBV38_07350 [Alistipes sp.]|jgi:hypothetical protein|nr:hypothetical protein [Alistipes sp.]
MKKFVFYTIALAAMLLAGCEEEKQWDFYNTEIVIDLRDGDGKNLFDAYHPESMRDNRVSISYDGATYPLVFEEPNTRAERVLPQWNANGRNPFRLIGYYETENSLVRLVFGEFSADTKNYHAESFNINWGDGTMSEVRFDLYAASNGKNEEPTMHEAIWVESGLGEGARTDNSLNLHIVKAATAAAN